MATTSQWRILISNFKLSYFVIFFLFPMLSAFADKETTANIHFTEKELAWIDKHPEVVVGHTKDFPPSLMVKENGDYIGVIPEVLALLSQATGISFRIELAPNWEANLANGSSRKVDMLGAVAQTKVHKEKYLFTPPSYLKDHFFIFAPESAPHQPPKFTIDDLKGKTVGYMDSYPAVKAFIKQHKDIVFSPFYERKKMVRALISGKVDFIFDLGALEYWRKKERINSFKIYGAIKDLDLDIMMAVRKDWPELQSILKKAFQVTREKRQKIVHYWLETGRTYGKLNSIIQLSIEEKAWLKANPVLKVGYHPFWAPIEFIEDNWQPQGISIEYLRRLQQLLGIRIEYDKSFSWMEAQEKLLRNEVDILPAISQTPTRQHSYNLTSPYLSIPISIFSAVDKTYLGDIEALKGKKVVVVKGYAIHEWLQRDYPNLELLTAPTIEAALKTVAKKEAYAFVGNLVSTSYYIGQTGLTQIRIVGETTYSNDLRMAVHKDHQHLASILQKGLNAIPKAERDAIYHNWISIKYKHSMDLTLLWQILGVAAVIFMIILYWNRRMAKEVAHRRKVESQLHIARQDAEQALVAKSEFLANMSHEIRTPLNAAIGLGHLMRQTRLNDEQADYMEKMRYSSEALLNTIDGILDFSRGEAGKLEKESVTFKLKDVLWKTLKTYEHEADKKGLELLITADPDLPKYLVGDAHKLGQVLRNLISNAIKFTERGNIELAAVELASERDDITVHFSVKDTGPGISPDSKQQLFKPFSQGDNSITRRYGGTGLGLIICKQLVEAMGGEITLKSQAGEGSTFSFIIDLEIGEPCNEIEVVKPENSISSTDQTAKLKGTKVLLVDDDEINLFLTHRLLIAFEVNVTTAENGKEALQALESGTFDILLLDIQMPEMDGFKTAEAIRSIPKWDNLPIIAFTAHALPAEREKCLKAGMNDYLSKPVNPDQLRQMLLKWTVFQTSGNSDSISD